MLQLAAPPVPQRLRRRSARPAARPRPRTSLLTPGRPCLHPLPQMFDALGLSSRPAFQGYSGGNTSSREFAEAAAGSGGCGGKHAHAAA